IIRDVRIRAHLCPFLSKGIISCFVTRLINHSWRVESRLVIQRLSSEGIRRAGNVIEIRMSGIPSRDGLENWSKKLRFMVRFRGWCVGAVGGLLDGGFIDTNVRILG
uniref:Uncharacterized protein n=2 Tax=Serinus canaria TaxID=9135 RepID=A0A8C9KU92_SERCA